MMQEISIIPNCNTDDDLVKIFEKLNLAKEIYDVNYSEYQKSLKTGDAIIQNNKFFIMNASKNNYEKIKRKIEEISNANECQSLQEKFSNVTGEDLNNIQEKINQALADYEEKNRRYLASPHPSWAKRNLLPGVNQAKDYLETLKRTYEEMQSVISKSQSIDLVDLTMEKADESTQEEIPWTTIGLAIGALVVVVIIVKII
jgi:DNA repair exonuclease SbcCD ATPase subunit